MAGNLKAFLAELIGTFALVFIGAGAVCADSLTQGSLGTTGIALAHALILTAMILAYGHVSGGHFNPAVTAGMIAVRRVNAIKGVLYIAAQLLGAALAAVCLKAVLHAHEELFTAPPFLGACGLSGVGFKAGTLMEAVATFFLMSAVMASSDPRAPAGMALAGIGMALAAGILALGPLTGAALNPARAFGPAVATGYWTNGFVYWIGPVTGAVAAAWIYENLFLEKAK